MAEIWRMTLGGKSLAEHLEATNHAAALRKVLEIARSPVASLTEHILLDLQAMVLRGIDDENAVASSDLLRIGDLAKKTGETLATLHHWMKQGLLEPADTTEAGYQLFEPEAADRVQRIRELQSHRRTLAEIRKLLAP